jgi:hypothetical protein
VELEQQEEVFLSLEERIEKDTRDVLKSRIADGCRNTYNCYNIRLVIWLFDHVAYHDIINEQLLPLLTVAHQRDCNRLTTRGTLSKKRDHIRDVCRTALDNIKSDDPSTHPLRLEMFNFTLMTNYFFTFKKSFKQTTIGGEQVIVPGRGEDEEQTFDVRLHPSSYDSVTSSLGCLFTECKVARDVNAQVKQMWEQIPLYKKGSARKGAKERQALGLRMTEGKDPMSLAAYIQLAEILCKSPDPEHNAAHLFLLLDWNLISRADTVVNSNIELVGMGSNALRFEIGPTKTDPTGKNNLDHPFHVYSCPENPAICTVLALCKHLINQPQILKGKCPLFEGSNQYQHYCNILRRIVQDPRHRQSFIDRGLNPNYFGTHSMRKGAVTYIACDITSSPPISSIVIRANWTFPGVLTRYIKHESAGDQYVGRCVSGRSRLNKRFAESIPYFDFLEYDALEKEVKMRQLDAWIKSRMPEAGALNDAVFFLFKSCLASLIFHREWILQNLHATHPIFTSPFFSEIGEFPFTDRVRTCFPWTKTCDTPVFTGIPADVLYMAKIEELEKVIETLQSRLLEDNNRVINVIKAHMDTALDDRAVGGDGYGLPKSVSLGKLEQLIEQNEKALPIGLPILLTGKAMMLMTMPLSLVLIR